jgi:hypothetical protein
MRKPLISMVEQKGLRRPVALPLRGPWRAISRQARKRTQGFSSLLILE